MNTTVSVRVDAELKARLEERALSEKLTPSEWVRSMIVDALERDPAPQVPEPAPTLDELMAALTHGLHQYLEVELGALRGDFATMAMALVMKLFPEVTEDEARAWAKEHLFSTDAKQIDESH